MLLQGHRPYCLDKPEGLVKCVYPVRRPGMRLATQNINLEGETTFEASPYFIEPRGFAVNDQVRQSPTRRRVALLHKIRGPGPIQPVAPNFVIHRPHQQDAAPQFDTAPNNRFGSEESGCQRTPCINCAQPVYLPIFQPRFQWIRMPKSSVRDFHSVDRKSVV